MQKILTLWILFSLASFGLTAAETNSTPKPPLRVGVSPVFPPMVFKQGKELVGVEVDLARALGKSLGRKVEFVEVPWKDQIDALNSRKTDIIMSSMSVTMARRYMVSFSKPYCVVSQMALVRRADKYKYSITFPSQPEGAIGVLRATTGEFLVEQNFPRSKRKTYESGEAAARALIRKKIGLFISDSTLVWYLAGVHAADGLTVVPIPLNEENLAWAVRKSDDALLSQVNDFIEQIVKDGRLHKTMRRWLAVGD